MTSLELADVDFRYSGTSRTLLRNINCILETGKLVALLGNNGSGKSTLARLMAGLLMPSKGSVIINRETFPGSWNGIGYIFQNPDEQLIAQQVERELAWGLENLNIPVDEIERRVERGLEFFGLQEKRNQPPECLSDGEKQLVAIASMWVMEPVFIILDEAAAFLDPKWKARLWEIAREWSHTAGVLWITANENEAKTADLIWILDNGHITFTGTPDKILSDNQ